MKRIKKYIILLMLVVGVGFLLSLTYSLAKYVGNTVWDYFLSTKGFYLSSDNLNNDYQENINEYWDNERVYLNIQNGQNELLITEYDIEYEASCRVTGDAALSANCLLDGTDSNEISGVLSSSKICINKTDDEVIVKDFTKTQCENGGYSWENQLTNKKIYFDIIYNDENELEFIEVEIILKSTVPYKKTLTGKFILKNSLVIEDNINLQYEDNINTGNLIITNPALKSKIVELSWNPIELLIDKDTSYIDSYKETDNYINKIYMIVSPKSSINLIYYKVDESIDISENNFNLAIINSNDYKPENLLNNMIITQNGGLDNINLKTSPNFETISNIEDTGIYKMNDDYGVSYYYRGNKELINNNLIFAEHQWKIVRINGDGSIRLIYNGTCPNNSCIINTNGSSTSIITTHWNDSINDNKFAGYMYGGTKSDASINKKDATTNLNSSNIKVVLEQWYKTNIASKNININSYMEDKIFCNDRNTNNEGYGLSNTVFNSNLRILETKSPSLICDNKNDRFTYLESKIGNAYLDYPIGLLTVDEANIAGNITSIQNTNNYLYTGQSFWLFSPSHFDGTSAFNFSLNYLGFINNNTLNNSYGLRPVINISSNVRAIGNGSLENPYIIK